MNNSYDILIVGAGVFGLTAAIELSNRGHSVCILDKGIIPHPDAASTDISKVVRIEYGVDEDYMRMGEEAIEGWHQWNEEWKDKHYHGEGVTMFTRAEMTPGEFEYESYHLMLKRGLSPQRMRSDDIRRFFPAWNPESYVDGFYHRMGGFVESGRVISTLAAQAHSKGVSIMNGFELETFIIENEKVRGVKSRKGIKILAETTIIAAGAASYKLVPELSKIMRATGHPVFHLDLKGSNLFSMKNFRTFTADVSKTGWYGFPIHPKEGVMKVANHGIGREIDPIDDERVVTGNDEAGLRDFLKMAFPSIADAPIVFTRRCLYCDTLDGHFIIDHHPKRPGLIVASGGSGHGFKFAPILGDIIADAVERKENPILNKFKWRDLAPDTVAEEASRYRT